MKLLDLFSGIGGFSLGLERAGFQTVAFCEASPVCRHLLAHHWPEVPCYDDVRTLTAKRLAADGLRVDAICGGFPCQDVSLAGRGAGLEGERSGLWREYARLVRELRPAFVFVENVAALLGRGLGTVLGDLASIGYDAWWDCIPADAVGADHQRDRVWIVAYPQRHGFQGGKAIATAWRQEPRKEQLAGLLLPRLRAEISAARAWRDAYGVSSRLDVGRNRALGNAVVPQIPELLGRAALAALPPQQQAAA